MVRAVAFHPLVGTAGNGAGGTEAAGAEKPAWLSVSRAVAVMTLVIAAVIHDSVVDVHFRRAPVEGVFLVVLAAVETFLAVALVLSRSPPLLKGAVALSVGIGSLPATSWSTPRLRTPGWWALRIDGRLAGGRRIGKVIPIPIAR